MFLRLDEVRLDEVVGRRESVGEGDDGRGSRTQRGVGSVVGVSNSGFRRYMVTYPAASRSAAAHARNSLRVFSSSRSLLHTSLRNWAVARSLPQVS